MCENLSGMGVKLITSNTEAEMRLCTSLVDERFGETTEIIEPWSAEVRDELAAVEIKRRRGVCRRITHPPSLVGPNQNNGLVDWNSAGHSSRETCNVCMQVW